MASIIRTALACGWGVAGRLGVVVAVLAVGVNALAETPDGKTPSAGDAALFDRLDANRDGSIAADEVAKDARALFERLVRRSDINGDKVLSRDEFLASLVPTRPAKPLEDKEPSTVPEANAVRYLLLTMDKNRNARIEKDEVPRELKGALDMLIDRMDRNNNGSLERQELSRGGQGMSGVAGRYVARMNVDVDAELAKLKKSEGEAFNRFEQQPMPLTDIRDAKQARQLFAQFDENADGKLESKEVPDPLQEPIARLTRIADRDGDGKLTQDEFVKATEQISRFMRRGGPGEMMRRDRRPERPDRKPKAEDSAAK
jgi:Ca2+-binding EF-hand superfamily protein